MRPTKDSPGWVLPGILILVVVVLNLNTLRNGFTYDDRTLFQPAGVATTNDFRPISTWSLSLNKAVLGGGPRAFHTFNVALSVVATLLVFLIGTEILSGRMQGFTAALLFAIHPVHVEAIQKIQQRGVLLAAVAVIAALWLMRRGRSGAGTSRIGTSAAIWGLYGIALLCSETAIVFVGLFVLFALWAGNGASLRQSSRQMSLDSRFWGIVALTAAYFFFCRAVTGRWLPFVSPSFLGNPLAFAGVHTRILTAIDLIRRSLVLVTWPFASSPDYSFDAVPLISGFNSRQFLASVAVLAAIIAAAVAFGRKKPAYLFACVFFLISVSVASNLWFPVGATISEAALYLPSVAICWAAAQLFADLGWILPEPRREGVPAARRFKSMSLVLICVIVPWTARTYLRNAEWHDDFVLYRAAVRTNPRNARCHYILGESYFSEADLLSAEREYHRAVEIYPGYREAANRLAAVRELLYNR